MDFLLLFDLWLGVCLSAAAGSSSSDSEIPKAENVRWVSLDFKTVLHWTAPASDYTYTVLYSEEDGNNWDHSPDCTNILETECDLTNDITYEDRTYTADVMTEGIGNFDPEQFPHTYSPSFNPYRHSELSAVSVTIHKVAEHSVTLNISDPLTGIHERDKQLTIRDVLKKDLKYKVSYHKSGSTGSKTLVVDSNLPPIPNLDPGQSYCFMVAAFVQSRDEAFKQGSWSPMICSSGSNVLSEVNWGMVFQVIFIPLVLLIILVTVVVIYCRCCRGKRKSTNTAQQPTAQCTVV